MLSQTPHSKRSELAERAKLNGIKVKNCATELSNNQWSYNSKINGFEFEIGLGECNMTSEMIKMGGNKFIKFTVELEFREFNLPVFFGQIGHYRYNCFYRATTTTSAQTYNVRMYDFGGVKEINQFVNWDTTVQLQFFDDHSYSEKLNPQALRMGQIVHFGARWLESFQSTFPVVFYLPNCKIYNAERTETFQLIKNGCLSQMVQVKRHSKSYVSDMLKMSFKSFSFSRTPNDYSMNMDCEVHFCLKVDQVADKCGFDPSECAELYSP